MAAGLDASRGSGGSRYWPPSVRVTVAFVPGRALRVELPERGEGLLGEIGPEGRPFDRLGQDLAVDRDLDRPVERRLSVMPMPFGDGPDQAVDLVQLPGLVPLGQLRHLT